LNHWVHVPVAASLGFIVLVVVAATIASLRITSKT
jgi:hypothetical protein